MSALSAIEWTETTWNPVTGCDRISPGCDHCYALRLAGRLKAMGQAKYQRDGDPRTSGPGFGVTCHRRALDEPLTWAKPRLVFVNSMSDLFHDQVPDDFIADVFDVMACHGPIARHTFQVLTKRPQRMAKLLQRWREEDGYHGAPNVWLFDLDCEPASEDEVLMAIDAFLRGVAAERDALKAEERLEDDRP